MRRGGGAGSGTALHCQRQAVSLHRFLFEIQEGLELCSKGGRSEGLAHALPQTTTPYPAPRPSRLTEEGWETPARTLVQEVGGSAGRSQVCTDQVSLRRSAGCSGGEVKRCFHTGQGTGQGRTSSIRLSFSLLLFFQGTSPLTFSRLFLDLSLSFGTKHVNTF